MDQEQLLSSLSDDELLRRLLDILRRAHRVEADIVEHIAEVDARRLYAREAAPSMFAYCTEVLHLSEAEAYLRITVARSSRRYPSVLRFLRDGHLHLSGIALLAPHLTAGNSEGLLARAVNKSKRGIEELIASIAPRPDVPASIRRLPEHREGLARVLTGPTSSWPIRLPSSVSGRAVSGYAPDEAPQPALRAHESVAGESQLRPDGVAFGARVSVSASSTPKPDVEPLAAGRYRVQFTASRQLRDKLERLRSLMRSQVPDGDLAAVIERAVSEAIDRIEVRRFGKATPHAKPRSRRRCRGRGTCRRPRVEPSSSATASGAGSSTRVAADARSVSGSSFTTAIRSGWAGTIARTTSGSCVARTTPGWPSTTTDEKRFVDTACRTSGPTLPDEPGGDTKSALRSMVGELATSLTDGRARYLETRSKPDSRN